MQRKIIQDEVDPILAVQIRMRTKISMCGIEYGDYTYGRWTISFSISFPFFRQSTRLLPSFIIRNQRSRLVRPP